MRAYIQATQVQLVQKRVTWLYEVLHSWVLDCRPIKLWGAVVWWVVVGWNIFWFPIERFIDKAISPRDTIGEVLSRSGVSSNLWVSFQVLILHIEPFPEVWEWFPWLNVSWDSIMASQDHRCTKYTLWSLNDRDLSPTIRVKLFGATSCMLTKHVMHPSTLIGKGADIQKHAWDTWPARDILLWHIPYCGCVIAHHALP